MSRSTARFRFYFARFFLLVFLLATIGNRGAFAQSGEAVLNGTITDPAGLIVDGVSVSLTPSSGRNEKTTKTNSQGLYEFRSIAPGSYVVSVSVAGFTPFNHTITIRPGDAQKLNIALTIQVGNEEIQVSGDEDAKLDLTPASNVSSMSITEKDMDALSDDPDELAAQLAALAGPSVGTSGAQLYVDGFQVEDQIPPKNSIREVRVNQNPFSPEYDKLGYGRIEIFTKPGTNQFHGKFTVDGNDLAFDTRNPFAPDLPGYHSLLTTADLSGPLSKNASFFFDFQNRNVENSDVINGVVLDSSLNPVPFAQALPSPSWRVVVAPRIDYQLTKNNTLSLSYQLWHERDSNLGIGQFALASQGYNQAVLQNIVRVNDTQIFGSRIVMQTRFQTMQQSYTQAPLSALPEINVIGAFIGGGSSQGLLDYKHHHYELDNDTSFVVSKHFFKFGGELRPTLEYYVTEGNFNGTYTFSSLNAYQITQRGIANGMSPVQIRATGGGPSQFTVTQGTPGVGIVSVDGGLYFADDWKVRPNFTLSYGLRFETQNYIGDHADWAPRLAFAWGFGRGSSGSPKFVLRGGSGIFYDRFGAALQLQAQILNGVNQTQYILNNPQIYPAIPTVGQLTSAGAATTVYRVAPDLRTPYTIQSGLGLERQVSKAISVSVTYLNSRGDHQFLTNNINAPLPGTYNPGVPLSGIRPFPLLGNIYEYQSVGVFEENQMISNFNVRALKNVTLFGFYSLSYANSDTNGSSSFPDNPYNISQDYGRVAFDIRSRFVVGGSISLKHGIVLSPLINFQSGTPFNITIGQDSFGTTIFNQRPAFATAATPAADVVATKYGNFNIAPGPNDALIPIYYGAGPSNFVMNLRVSKTFTFGAKRGEHGVGDVGGGGAGAPGGRAPGTSAGLSGGNLGSRGLSNTSVSGGSSGSANKQYALTLSASGRNIFNTVNFGTPVGNLTSPLFGQSNALAGGVYSFSGTNRRIDFQAVFSF